MESADQAVAEVGIILDTKILFPSSQSSCYTYSYTYFSLLVEKNPKTFIFLLLSL